MASGVVLILGEGEKLKGTGEKDKWKLVTFSFWLYIPKSVNIRLFQMFGLYDNQKEKRNENDLALCIFFFRLS